MTNSSGASRGAASTTPLLRLSGASFGYGRHEVVSSVDLEVHPGELIGILGPNGSGKTTLFRGILGLIPARAGSVERPAGAIGYVPQRERLDPIYPVTVEEVVHMGCYGRLRGWRGLSSEERALAERCLERVDMGARRREAFAALSGGQRQRTLIARALMVRPKLLLLDEPTSGVDRAAQERILGILDELRDEGLAVLLVSHQLGLVREAMPELLWVADGRVTRGRTEELLSGDTLDHLFLGGGATPGGRAQEGRR